MAAAMSLEDAGAFVDEGLTVAYFAGRSNALSEELRKVAKVYFDACADLLTEAAAAKRRTGRNTGKRADHLPTLAADSFDCEQIWHQLEHGQNLYMDMWVKDGVAAVEGLDAGDIFPGLLNSDDDDEDGDDDDDGNGDEFGAGSGGSERYNDIENATDEEEDGEVNTVVCQNNDDDEGPAKFIKTDWWSGPRAGYVFTTRNAETGYYLDNRRAAMKALRARRAGENKKVRIVADANQRGGTRGMAPPNASQASSKGLKGLVEDRFLKLDDMEAFLKEAEAESVAKDVPEDKPSQQEIGGRKGGKLGAADVDDEERAMDLLYGGMEDSDGTDGEEEDDDSDADYYGLKDVHKDGSTAMARKAKYADFFDPPADGEDPGVFSEDLSDEGDQCAEDPEVSRDEVPGPSDRSELAKVEDGGGRTYHLGGNEDTSGEEAALTKHQRNLRRIQQQIDELERQALDDKHWSLKGEVKGTERPKDSALEIEMDFDHNVRPAPVITEETTQNLEDLILRRIADGLFDDPKRAPLPELSARKLLDESSGVPDQKSDRGLGDVMEDEFRSAVGKGFKDDPARDRAVLECRKIFKELVQKLDVLTNYHFTPSNIPDMAVTQPGNVPALVVEEKLPEHVSMASMLAPEEVYKTGKNQGEATQESELTHEDRRRRRRAIKRKVRFLNNLDGVKAAKAAREMDDKVKAANKVAKKLGRGAGLKSTQFFKSLQDSQDAGAAKRSRVEQGKETRMQDGLNPASLRL